MRAECRANDMCETEAKRGQSTNSNSSKESPSRCCSLPRADDCPTLVHSLVSFSTTRCILSCVLIVHHTFILHSLVTVQCLSTVGPLPPPLQ